ncbi:MAG: surfeit locus 1 family protein [Paraglaciecola sp.]
MNTKFPSTATLVTLLSLVIMFALGCWQLQRANEKSLRLEQIEEASKNDPFSLIDILKGTGEQRDLPLKVRGRATDKRYFLVDNKIEKGRVGFHVLVPLETEQGWLLGDFGWIAGTADRQTLPTVGLDTSMQTYHGVIAIPTLNPMISETATIDGVWPKLIQQIDLTVMEQHFEQAFLPVILLLAPDEGSPFIRNWQPVVMAPEKHIAYAIQWFGLGIAALVIFIFAQRNRLRKEQS